MDSENDSWHPSFVMSVLPGKHFFVIIDKGISAILMNAKDIRLGDFFDVKYVLNSQATEANRAQHLITHYRPIDPLAQTRINTDERGLKHVVLTTRADYVGMVVSSNKRVANLYNNKFGYFIDLNDLVKQRHKEVEFEFKCKASQLDQYRSIFVPTKIIEYNDIDVHPKQNPCRKTIIGFICSRQQDDGSRRIWSKDLDTDACLDATFCPSGTDVGGRWVEAVVDVMNNRVMEMVNLIDDIVRSRICSGVPEIFVDFHFFDYDKNQRVEIYMSDFGLIIDNERMVDCRGENESYSGWIARNFNSDIDWKFSPKQHPIRAKYEQTPTHWPANNYFRPDSRQSIGSFYPPPPTFRDDNHENSNYFGGSNQDRQASPPNNEHVDFLDDRSNSPERGLTTSEESDADDTRLNVPRRADVASSLNDVMPARRRQVGSSNYRDPENSAIAESDSESDDGDCHQRDQSRGKNSQLSRPPIIEVYTPLRKNSDGIHSNYATPMGQLEDYKKTSTSHQNSNHNNKLKTKSDQENMRQELLWQKYAATVKYFIEEKVVSQAMQSYDVEQYHELKNLGKNNAFGLQQTTPDQVTEKDNRALTRKLQKIADTIDFLNNDGSVFNAMRTYDEEEFQELLKCKQAQQPKSSPERDISIEQEHKLLRLKLKKFALSVSYFIKHSEVSIAMQSSDESEYEDLKKLIQL